MTRSDRVYDPASKRWYKRGYSPEELTREPIEATCIRCGGRLLIYPAGGVCETCSPVGLAATFANANDRSRVRRGYMPASELLP